MKFQGQRLSKNEETTLYDFTMGARELRLMYDFLREAYLRLPKEIMEIQQTRSRLHSIVKELELQVRANKIKP